jgi:hypothetical protein
MPVCLFALKAIQQLTYNLAEVSQYSANLENLIESLIMDIRFHKMPQLRAYHSMIPLRDRHVEMLQLLQVIPSAVEVQAGWANRHWSMEVGAVLGQLANSTVLKSLGLQRNYSREGAAANVPAGVNQEDQENATIFFQLVVCTAASRAWSMAHHSEVPPDSFAGILSADPAEAYDALRRIKHVKRLIDKAKLALEDTDHPEYEAGRDFRT